MPDMTEERKAELRRIYSDTPDGGVMLFRDESERRYIEVLDAKFKRSAPSAMAAELDIDYSRSAKDWPRPIPVSERLPEEITSVLTWPGYRGNDGWQVGAYWPDDSDCQWRSLDGDSLHVTHWLPLPPRLCLQSPTCPQSRASAYKVEPLPNGEGGQ